MEAQNVLMLGTAVLLLLACAIALLPGVGECDDCAHCKREKKRKEDERRKRNDDYWNGRRGRP